MIIVIRQYVSSCDGACATALMGTYESEDAAREAIAEQLAQYKEVWEDENEIECDSYEDTLFEGTNLDHDGAYKWIVFDTDKPREVWY